MVLLYLHCLTIRGTGLCKRTRIHQAEFSAPLCALQASHEPVLAHHFHMFRLFVRVPLLEGHPPHNRHCKFLFIMILLQMEVQYPEEGKQIANLHQGVWASMDLARHQVHNIYLTGVHLTPVKFISKHLIEHSEQGRKTKCFLNI